MSWSRFDDRFSDDRLLAQLPIADRWHYFCMVQFCSRTDAFDGIMRIVDAQRCSDHPDTPAALKLMAAIGLVTVDGDVLRINRIDEHVPPPSVRANAEQSRLRMKRMRNHKAGFHEDCLPDNCPNVTRVVTRNTGTGQDRTGRDYKQVHTNDETDPEETERDPLTWPMDADGVESRLECEELGVETVEDYIAKVDPGANLEQALKAMKVAFPQKDFSHA